MFREMRKTKQRLSLEECEKVLIKQPRGVLSINGENGYPYGVPINFYYDRESKRLFIHGGKHGYKVDALTADPKVSFCIYDKGFRREGEWALNIKSVIIFGQAKFIEDPDEKYNIMYNFGKKYFPTIAELEHEMKGTPHTSVIEIKIDHMTGKLVNES